MAAKRLAATLSKARFDDADPEHEQRSLRQELAIARQGDLDFGRAVSLIDLAHRFDLIRVVGNASLMILSSCW